MKSQAQPLAETVLVVSGIKLATCAAGIRYKQRKDVSLIALAKDTTVAGIFTRNQFQAAPIIISTQHLRTHTPRYLLINSGNANAGLGEVGIQDGLLCCRELAHLSGVNKQEVLLFSTGVIGERLAVEKIIKVLPELLGSLSEDAWLDTAQAIMTTDTVRKYASTTINYAQKTVTITGIAKGAGMIFPNMGTMLAFIASDIQLEQKIAQDLLTHSANTSFNAITVDGDTSTNDACVLLASGASGVRYADLNLNEKNQFITALDAVLCALSEAIIRDAEGAEHFIHIQVQGAQTESSARCVAETVAHSPLVKTALAAADPNWGRILAAVGRAQTDIDINRVDMFLGDCCVVKSGAVAADYTEEKGIAALAQKDILLRIVLGSGDQSADMLTSDLTTEYVRINAEYRS